MARQPRYVLPGHPQHLIQRGNNKGSVFFQSDDYLFYLRCLRQACTMHECEVHAYVLMPNHAHLLVTPRRENSISKVIQSVGGRYAQYLNLSCRRTGSVWEGRYRSTIVDPDEYLLYCMAYIELNPVRANIVGHPGEYRWSSYHRNANGCQDEILTEHPVFRRQGETPAVCQDNYRQLLGSPFDNHLLETIRNCTHKGWALAGARFRERLEGTLNRRMQPLSRGGDRRSKSAREQQLSITSDPFEISPFTASSASTSTDEL